MKKIIVDLIYNSLENIEKQLIERTTNESKLNEYDYANSIFISNKNLDFESFKEKLLQNKLIKKVDFVNSYINILLDRIYLLNNFSLDLEKENKKIMLEFPSPNSNKPLHLGHVRNMLLGQSLSNLLEKKYSIIRADLINDRGIHICKSMLGYLKYSEFKSPEQANRKSDFFVGDCYVLYSNAEKENPEIIKEAELLLQKWESGDKETLELWQKMKTWAINGMDETFKELGLKFDKVYYESDIYKNGKEIILDAYKNGKVILDNELGYLVKLSDKKEDYKVVLRKDLTSIYITQDIYLAKLKFDEFNLDKSIYVIGSEQNEYISKLIKIVAVLGYPEIANKMEHFSYGMISLPSGKMKSREGTVVDADNLINEVREKALDVLKEKNLDASENLINKSKVIGDAALRYFILKYDAKKEFVFDINSSLSFEGNSGPYILYTYARICSVLKKMKETNFKEISCLENIFTDEELNLVRIILKYPDKLQEAIDKESVHFLVTYITDLANNFNTTYSNIKFITENNEEIANRYFLYSKMKLVFEDVAKIMGIKLLERM